MLEQNLDKETSMSCEGEKDNFNHPEKVYHYLSIAAGDHYAYTKEIMGC